MDVTTLYLLSSIKMPFAKYAVATDVVSICDICIIGLPEMLGTLNCLRIQHNIISYLVTDYSKSLLAESKWKLQYGIKHGIDKNVKIQHF